MGPKPREERRNTFLRARMRTEGGWSDVTIANVSSRGLMLQCGTPLERNAFIEVRHCHVCIVGRVVWARGAKCGVRTQDKIDLAGLLSQAPSRPVRPGHERRTTPRTTETRRPQATAAAIAESSRHFARAFDWTIMVLAAGTAGLFVAQSAWTVLDTPLARVGIALSAHP